MAASTTPQPEDYTLRIRRWLEYVEFAIDAESERQRVDTLLELADSLETAWLAAIEQERAA